MESVLAQSALGQIAGIPAQITGTGVMHQSRANTPALRATARQRCRREDWACVGRIVSRTDSYYQYYYDSYYDYLYSINCHLFAISSQLSVFRINQIYYYT